MVAIIWSLTSQGSGITDLDHGSLENGESSDIANVFLRHDGNNAITDCSFYFQAKTGVYSGAFTAAADFAEIRGWGDASVIADHGGVQINMDPTNNTSYNVSTWDLDESTKATAVAFTMHTGTGDSVNNSVLLNANMSANMNINGEIPVGAEAEFMVRWNIPSSEDAAGARQITQTLQFTYTS